ncbi:uncharacterized protein LOC122320136 [Drosophila ficusphila]|uniref:uncharacterized protein LOC122320136 n=1 Tax=Drosophila ficusphila TaxID=30025 RepID=UPI001C898423|nr:uncharacterized protein LOC122320136 [Drosophila ficusphila]
MIRREHLFFLLSLFVWISFADRQAKKEVIFNTIECMIRSKILSKLNCRLETRMALSVAATVNHIKAVDKLEAVFDAKLIPNGQKPIPIKNIKVDYCHLKKYITNRSVMATYYKAFRRAAVNFPNKCPFLKNTTYLLKRLHFEWQETPQYLPESNITLSGKIYANNELGFEVKLTGGFYEIKNYSLYTQPLP